MNRRWIFPIALVCALAAAPARADAGNDLIDAAYRGDVEAARAILQAGAMPAVADVHGDTPLHWAAREGHADVVKLLLAKGAPLDAANREGETPLMQATSHGQLDVVKFLLASGAAVEPRDREGHNAVDLAMQSGMDALIVVVQEAANGVRPDPPTPGAEAVVGLTGLRETLLGLDERMKTLGPRIDALPFAALGLETPPALPVPRWEGQKFMFLPMERDQVEEAPSFTLGDQKPSPETRNAPYEGLVGRIGTITHAEAGAVLMRMDDDGSVLRGAVGAHGNLPELAPAVDLYLARKLYTGKILWPKDSAIERYTRARGPESRLAIGPGVPVLVRGVFPGENAANPVRLVLETADKRQGFLDMTLSGTNAPTDATAREVYRFNDLFFAANPRALGWSGATWAAIRRGRVLIGFKPDMVRAAWGRPTRVEGAPGSETWRYDEGDVTFDGGRVIRVAR